MQPDQERLRAAIQETVAAASEDGLQLVRDMQAHPEGCTLLQECAEVQCAVAQGASAAAGREDAAAAQVYLDLLVPTLTTGSLSQARLLCLDALRLLMRPSSGPPATAAVLTHLHCIAPKPIAYRGHPRLFGILSCLLRDSQYAAGHFFDLLCSIRMACNESQKESLLALLKAAAPVLCVGNGRGDVLPQERQGCRRWWAWWRSCLGRISGIGPLWWMSMTGGAVVLDLPLYVNQLDWEIISGEVQPPADGYPIP